MVAFSDEVSSSYAVPKKPFWGRPPPETTMRCLGGIIQGRIEDEKETNSRKVGKWQSGRALAEQCSDDGREIFCLAAVASLVFLGTRSISGLATRRSRGFTRAKQLSCLTLEDKTCAYDYSASN